MSTRLEDVLDGRRYKHIETILSYCKIICECVHTYNVKNYTSAAGKKAANVL